MSCLYSSLREKGAVAVAVAAWCDVLWRRRSRLEQVPHGTVDLEQASDGVCRRLAAGSGRGGRYKRRLVVFGMEGRGTGCPSAERRGRARAVGRRGCGPVVLLQGRRVLVEAKHIIVVLVVFIVCVFGLIDLYVQFGVAGGNRPGGVHSSSDGRRAVSDLQIVARHGERADGHDPLAQLADIDTLERVELKDGDEQLEAFVRYRQYLSQVPRVVEKQVERFVRRGSLSPGVPTADEVDEYDAERPDVSWSSGVGRGLGPLASDFGGNVERAAAAELGRDGLFGGEAKVAYLYAQAAFGADNVFGFDVAVGYAEAMQVFYTVDELKKDVADKLVVADILNISTCKYITCKA